MKLFFSEDDSLYKIFKTLEKIPRWKEVEISIEATHPLFDNEWWWKQIKEILDKRTVNATFSAQNEKSKNFFEKIWLKTNYVEKNKILKALKTVYLFFFDIKKFHLDTKGKKFGWALIFWFEVIFTLAVLYLIYLLVIPNAKITINPSQNTETIIYNFRYYPATDTEYKLYSKFISMPYYTWSFEYKYDLSINTMNVKYLQNPSVWKIKIYNTLEKSFTLIPNTRFITEDWRLFQTLSYIDVPAWANWAPWEKVVTVKAMEHDDNGLLMWNRWNIPWWTKLLIKNMKESFFLNQVYAIAMSDFSGGTMDSEWKISQEDIELLSWKLVSYINQQKKNIAIQNFSNSDWVLLTFFDTISYDIKSIEIPYEVWDDSTLINWTVTADMYYMYIKWADLINAFAEYIQQRPSEKSKFISLDQNSLVFYEEDGSSDDKGVYVVPTKIQAIQWYDFTKDINGIIDEIKDHIVWAEKEEARSFILQYPEISSVKLKVTPWRYSNIPRLKSRIKISINSL